MKMFRITLLTLALVRCGGALFGQSAFKPGIMKLPRGDLKVEFSQGSVYAHKVTRFEADSAHAVPNDEMYAPLKDPDAFLIAARDVFTKERIKELLLEDNISLKFEIDYTGIPRRIWFNMRKNTKVTPVELIKMDTAVRKYIVFVVPEHAKMKTHNRWYYSMRVRFNKVYP